MNLTAPLQVERLYDAPINKVWDFITKQEYLTKWLMPGNFTAVEGFDYHFDYEASEDHPAGQIFGKILEVEEPNFIKFSWNYYKLKQSTIVSFILKETEGGVLFSVEHEGFMEGETVEFESFTEGWKRHMLQIDDLIEK